MSTATASDVDRRKGPGPRSWAGLVLGGLVVVLAGVGFVAMATGTIGGPDLTAGDRIAPLPLSLFAAVGGLLAFRRPGNPIGWLLIAFALLQVAGGTSPLVAYSDRVPIAVRRTANWFGSWSWVPSIAGLGLVLVSFPDGRLPSRKWRPVLLLLVAGIAGGLVIGGLLWPHREEDLLAVGDQWPGAAGTVAFPVLMAMVVAASTLLVAALFGPLLRRVRAVVDRRFNRAAHVDARASSSSCRYGCVKNSTRRRSPQTCLGPSARRCSLQRAVCGSAPLAGPHRHHRHRRHDDHDRRRGDVDQETGALLPVMTGRRRLAAAPTRTRPAYGARALACRPSRHIATASPAPAATRGDSKVSHPRRPRRWRTRRSPR